MLSVQKDGVHIQGVGAQGLWWGTRTLLQEIVLALQSQPEKEGVRLRLGTTHDAPSYRTRGFMLDAGRKWYTKQFLKDLCTYASYVLFAFYCIDDDPR